MIQRNLVVRTASAVILLGIALGAAYLGGIPAGIVAAALAVIVQVEWANVTGEKVGRMVPFAIAVALATVAASAGMLAVAIGVAALAAIAAGVFTRGAWLPAGVVYASVLGLGLVGIRVSPDHGFSAVVFLLAIVWATDSFAYFVGRVIGGAKLWPQISPKKTWSGAIGGLIGGVAVGVVVARVVGVTVTLELAIVALVLSILSQSGDLFESWVKRHFGVKDSGNIIPGHGGMMDRIDGLVFAAAAAIMIGAGHAGAGDLGRGLIIW